MKRDTARYKGTPYPNEIRIEAERLRKEEGFSRTTIAKMLNVSTSTISNWFGPTGKRISYPKEARIEAKKLWEEGGLSIGEIAQKMGASKSTIGTWIGKGRATEVRWGPYREKLKQAVEMSQQGMSDAVIGRELGVSNSGVGRWLRGHGRPLLRERKIYSEQFKQEALDLVSSGQTITGAARQLGVSAHAVKAWLNVSIIKGSTKKPEIVRNRAADLDFDWLKRDYPNLETWQEPAAEWIRGAHRNLGSRIVALSILFTRYLGVHVPPYKPYELLRRGTTLPDYFSATCSHHSEHNGTQANNIVHDFLQWLLLRDFSERADDGTPIPSPAFHNPVERRTHLGALRNTESVWDPLPYGWVDYCRKILVQGPDFRDWTWAQSATGGDDGRNSRDWFEVTEDMLDKNDPDCVWRIREFISKPPILEMWSPVRWVTVLIKLQLPPRTFQVRMLDSGESDTWRYQAGKWALNEGTLASGAKGKPWKQGVFRRIEDRLGVETAILYFNTNKTADAYKSGKEKGQEIPWPDMREKGLDNQPYYWLEKLRNWQEKYNPISHRTSWGTIPMSILNLTKTEVQLAGYPDTCFLFRAPENKKYGTAHLPVSDPEVRRAWHKVLMELEGRLEQSGVTHKNGSRVRLIDPDKNMGSHFPLHCLRVSLITELATTGGVPLEILVKVVGHSRLVMTLYYTKPGHRHMQDALVGAAARLEANKDKSILTWLENSERNTLLQQIVFNSTQDITTVLQEHPANRNPVGWMLMHHGVCLAGGNNASELDPNYKAKGCHNGGSLTPGKGINTYAPVPGGARNCIRCRWFVTEPHYVPALGAHLGNLMYHLCESRAVAAKHENALAKHKDERYDAERTGLPFMKMDELNKAERLYESAMNCFTNLAMDVAACQRLIERCGRLKLPTDNTTSLVAIGDAMEVHAAIEETDSELLQLTGVCQNVEIYPDLDAGKAIFRQSQLLDSLLMREGAIPFFMALNEEEQLKYGNAFMRKLAQQADSSNPMIGFRKVCGLVDAGKSLTESLGINVRDSLPVESESPQKAIPIRIRKGSI